ncbi:MAG: hypothetical protein V4553_05655 [Bacteroidota bacterium]
MKKLKLNLEQLNAEFESIEELELSSLKGGDGDYGDYSNYGDYDGGTDYTNYGGYGGYGSVSVGPIEQTGVAGDLEMHGTGNALMNPNYGINGSWSGTGTYQTDLQQDGTLHGSVNLSINVPGAFNDPFAHGGGTVYIDGVASGHITLRDGREPQYDGESVMYQTGTIPMSADYTLPASAVGKNVTIGLNVGVGNQDNQGNTVVNSSQTISVGTFH